MLKNKRATGLIFKNIYIVFMLFFLFISVSFIPGCMDGKSQVKKEEISDGTSFAKEPQISEKTTEGDPGLAQEEITENTSAEETSEDINSQTDTDEIENGTLGDTGPDTGNISGSDNPGMQDDIPVLAATEETGMMVPTVLLKIISGPEYAQGDQICFYRIKADVTGDPSPVLSFSKDDSNGAWGIDTVQVNLKKNESYSLSCSAENEVGSDESSLVLSWVDKPGTAGSSSGSNTSPDPVQ